MVSKFHLPKQEAARLNVLYKYEILDTSPEAVFDNLASLAACVCDTSIALINFIDHNRQWFKANIGGTCPELSRNVGFCPQTILQPELLMVPDACQDIRFADNPLVTCEPYIRFYAGLPLITPDGQAIGTLCVMAQHSRILDRKQAEALSMVARQVVSQLESRRQLIDSARLIAERQQTEASPQQSSKALRDSVTLIRLIADALPIRIAYLDPQQCYLFVNKRYEEWFGLAATAIVGKTIEDIMGTSVYQKIHGYIEAVLSGKEVTYEVSLTKEGEERYVNVAYIPHIGERGEVLGFFVLVQDITQRRRAEEELRSSEERFRQLAENLHQIFWMSSVDMKQILYISPAYEEIVQRTCVSLYQQPDSWLDAIHPEDREHVIAAVEKQLRAENSYDVEYRIVRRDETIRCLRARVFPVRNFGGEIYRFAGIAEDITERKQAEQQIQASLKEKEVLLKEIHHRVKNNLQVISSLLKLQSGYIQDKQVLESFKESQSRIKSIALIHENLYQSKNLSQINFAEYVQQLVVNLFRAYGVNSSAISLKVQVEDVLLGVDTAITCGLIINELVSNCLKYAFPKGKIGEISILLIRVPNQDNKLVLTIRDNGVGFPKNIDFRNPESLGLQLVNTLAAQIKGNIEFNCNGITEFNIEFLFQNGSK